MNRFESFIASLNSINEKNFDDIALAVFRYQAEFNLVYSKYIKSLKVKPHEIASVDQIPFLPISFFKSHTVKSGSWDSDFFFLSSGTTGQDVSKHEIWSTDFYISRAIQIFENRFGSLKNFHLLALLPSYLEREGSSLVSMINGFIQATQSSHSGFYLHNHQTLLEMIKALKGKGRKVLVWGVSFALLDLAESGNYDLSGCLVVETGGMKGRRKEIVREELHSILRNRLNVEIVHSEYGMTELLSQAYTDDFGYFNAPHGMKVIAREINDPFEIGLTDRTGGLNVVDIANFHSCSFIETQDLGRVRQDGRFEVLGRYDNSDIRGCNLLI